MVTIKALRTMGRWWLLAACLGILAVALAGMRRVPPHPPILRESALRADRVLEPGWHFSLPLAERLLVLDRYHHASKVTFPTPEGARLDVDLRVDIRFSPEGARRLLESVPASSATASASPPRGLARLASGIDTLATGILTGAATQRVPDLDGPVRDSLTEVLTGYGSIEGPVEMSYAPDSAATLALQASRTRDEIRARARETGVRILLVGLDGADWQIIDPLVAAGRLPNFAALRRRAAWGNLRTLKPPLSPLLWTSVATGMTADRHGIVDFLVRDPATGARVPVSSRFRRAPALWNIFSDAGRRTDVVAWWATWPAEPVNGHMVSDRLSYSLFDIDQPTAGAGTTNPTAYYDEIRPRLVHDDQITYGEIARYADVSRGEYEAARRLISSDRRAAYRHPLNHLAKILAATRNYHLVALDLLERGQADFLAVYYQQIDEVCHRFIHFAPPRREGVALEDVRRYGQVVPRIYEHQDALLGELLRAAGSSTVVILLSDHGFLNGPDRPRGMTADIEGQPGRWHRPFGILALAGPPIAPGRLQTASLLDIMPTVLYLAGLPVPADASGRILTEAVSPAFSGRFPPATIDTYQAVPFHVETTEMTAAMAASEAEIVENLRSLGYIGDTGEESPRTEASRAPAAVADPGGTAAVDTVTAHTNLAAVHLAAGNLQDAEAEVQAALRLAPDSRPPLQLLFDLRTRQKRYDEAIRVAESILSTEENAGPIFMTQVAETYRKAGRLQEGLARFRTAFDAGRWAHGVPLARLQLDGGDPAGASTTARFVLERDPVNEAAMAVLFLAARARGRLAEAEPFIDAALRVNDRSVMFLNWKAILLESRGSAREAEGLLTRALEANPDHGGSMANLGAFYGRHGRTQEAIALLERALRIDPGNIEGRVNLASFLAMSGRYDEAIHHFEDAVRRGPESTTLANALARAYGEKGDIASARVWLQRSLALDPNQPQVRHSLARLDSQR